MTAGLVHAPEIAVAAGRLRGFLSGAREIDGAPLRCEGLLPAWLRGTLLLNGPALWDLPGGSLKHWFDGYAMLHRLHFGAGVPTYRSRFVHSEAWRRAQAAGAPVLGEFGSPSGAGWLERLKGPQATDNPAVVISRLGSQWFAVTETTYLTLFDADTLATGPRLDLAAQLPMHLMAAHGHTGADGSYLNLGMTLGPKCGMTLFRIDPHTRRAQVLNRLRLARASYLHGFALAPGQAVVWECALRAQPMAFRFGAEAYKDKFRWDPAGGSMLHALPLDGGPVRSWRIPPMLALHATQAWAEGDDLLLELAIYDDATLFDDLLLAPRREARPLRSAPRLVRYRLRAGATEAEPEALGVAIEFQQVHPARIGQRRARVCWGSGMGPAGEFTDRTLRVDLDSGRVTAWRRVQAMHLEPLFVPRPGGRDDDDGVLLVPTLADADESTVIGVVDARTMECMAQVHAPQVIPFGFHAAWAA